MDDDACIPENAGEVLVELLERCGEDESTITSNGYTVHVYQDGASPSLPPWQQMNDPASECIPAMYVEVTATDVLLTESETPTDNLDGTPGWGYAGSAWTLQPNLHWAMPPEQQATFDPMQFQESG